MGSMQVESCRTTYRVTPDCSTERWSRLDNTRNIDDLDEALRHARAGMKALEAARATAGTTGQIYSTHIHLAAVELAHAIEESMKVALRAG